MLHDTQHRHIMNGDTTEDAYNNTLLLFEAKLALTSKGLHDFLEMPLTLRPAKMLCVNPQLVAELDYEETYSMATSTKISHGSTFAKK
jgi:hypothetical protein